MPLIQTKHRDSTLVPLPVLLSTFVFFVVTVPFCAFYLTDLRTEGWHRLPPVEYGTPRIEWMNGNIAGENRCDEISLFRRDGRTTLIRNTREFEISGQYSADCGGFVSIAGYHNLQSFGDAVSANQRYFQSRYNLPNSPDGEPLLPVLLRVDYDVPMADVERVVETLELAGISRVGYVGAKNP